MPLEFYEQVEVLSCHTWPDRVGKLGHVLGRSYENDDPEAGRVVAYGVFFADVEQVYSFDPHELRSTGEIAPRSMFYPT
jgi:hypothetical protein